MESVTAATLPRTAPTSGIYLFSEGDNHLYIGRTRMLRQRMGQHSRPGSRHNQAVFAFRLAREATGRLAADYAGDGRREALVEDKDFSRAFTEAKARVRNMDLRYVEEADPIRQSLLEIYASVVLETPYNDFDTH
ncbi:GIY-YIG nuclease family protein [Lentisalinibacter orientalis]|uniref:GIY-YIG nuclease family protein n=1 Tax=Lentisalinibacter orientalis TaxID=2992241 RepID=UPI0038683460